MNDELKTKDRQLVPYVLIQPYHSCITIGKGLVKCLGNPKYIALRINISNDTFAIIPCEEHDPLSFKVPDKLLIDHHCVFRLNSKQFVTSLVLNYGLDTDCIYGYNGFYHEKLNAVIVSLGENNLRKVNSLEEIRRDKKQPEKCSV